MRWLYPVCLAVCFASGCALPAVGTVGGARAGSDLAVGGGGAAQGNLDLAGDVADLAQPAADLTQPAADLGQPAVADLALPIADLGQPRDLATATSCSHPICSTGGKLSAACDSCASKVCARDSYCCNTGWNSICVGEVGSICGQSCP